MKKRQIINFFCLLLSILIFDTHTIYAIDLAESVTNLPNFNIEDNTTAFDINTPKENTIVSIELGQEKVRLNPGDNRYLNATVIYTDSKTLPKEIYTWYSNDSNIATVDQKGVVTGVSKGTTYICLKGNTSNIVAKCKVTVKKTKYIAFTFDDGPGAYTDKLLNSLDQYDYKATFFVLGNRLENYGNILNKAYELDMEIGSHTYSHPNLLKLTKKEIKKELTKNKKLIKEYTGEKPTLFRPPYGNYNKIVSENCGTPMIYWSIDFEDWKYKDTKYVYKKILSTAKDGEIVLLHDIHKTTVKGFKKALPKLKKRNFELVTVSELYKIKGVDLETGKMHYKPAYDK